MPADEDPLLDQLGSIRLHGHRHVHSALRVVEVRAHEEEDAIAFAIPERVVEEQRAVVDVGIFLDERITHLAKRHDQFSRAGLDIHHEQPVVLRIVHAFGPVPRAGITRHRPQPRHTRVVDGRKHSAVLLHAAVGGRRGVEAEFLHALLIDDVVESREDLACSRIAVVEEELPRGLLGVPVDHRALLWIPASRAFDSGLGVFLVDVEQHDVRDVLRSGHAVLKCRAQRDEIFPIGAVRRVADMADVSVEVM